jgi:hypothetical protein
VSSPDGFTGYLAGEEARDVSIITGIPWYWGRTETRGAAHPLIDLSTLSRWDRVRVTWALVAAHALLESLGHNRRDLEEERNQKYWAGAW